MFWLCERGSSLSGVFMLYCYFTIARFYCFISKVVMLGLDLSRDYYALMIKPLIDDHFPQINGGYAAALAGWGSDVLANDDEFSQDHEWGPRCFIFLPDSLLHLSDDLLNLFNTKIPPFFMGYPTKFTVDKGIRIPSRDGSGEVNIQITTPGAYFARSLGVVVPSNEIEWLSLPENKLLEITGGEVFFDGNGELTAFRDLYKAYYPLNVWKYRLAYAWQSLGWDIDLIGLCDARGDFLSSRNCLSVTLFRIMKLAFLLNRKYSPSYPKWLGKEFYKLPYLSNEIGPVMESCYLDTDAQSIIGKLEAICSSLMKHQNSHDELPGIDAMPCHPARGFWHIDLQHIADQVFESISGPLREISLDGAVDQWVTNEDFLLNSNKLKLLSVIYKQKE